MSKSEEIQKAGVILTSNGFVFYGESRCCGRTKKYKKSGWLIKLFPSALAARLYNNNKIYSGYVPLNKIETLIQKAV